MTKPTDTDDLPPGDEDPYALPPESADEPPPEVPPLDDDEEDHVARRAAGLGRGGSAVKAAIAIGVVVVVVGALLGYRSYHRARVVREGVARAEGLLRLDTAAGYRDAAANLEPLADLDAIGAASVRAFSLAMLFADYRDPAAEEQAEALLVQPGRAAQVPRYANLAYAALALGRREAGNAATAASRAGDEPWAHALEARVALLAANLEAGEEPAARAAAAELPAGLAVQGDVLRRSRKDLAGARAAYEAALVASPLHPRAAFGLAKLALGGQGDANTARAALERLLDDRTGTPGAERGRAALHLAALLLRAREPSPFAPLDRAGLSGAPREWAAAAARAAAEHPGAYRAVAGAPAPLQSASDDDPADLPPWRPPPPPPPKPAAAAVKKPTRTAVKPAAKRTATKKAPARTLRRTTTRRTRN